MAYSALGNIKKNSVSTTTTSDITAVATTIPFAEMSVFHDQESGALITTGIVLNYDNATETVTEEITATAATATSGPGNLTGCTRGVKADGTIGAGYAHPSGTRARVSISKSIYDKIRDNIAYLYSGFFDINCSKALTGQNIIRNVDNSTISLKGGTASAKGAVLLLTGADYTSAGRMIVQVPNAAADGVVQAMSITGKTDNPQFTFCSIKKGATASVADGGTVTHGVGIAPGTVVCTPSVAAEMVSVTAISSTTFTVAIKKHDGSAGTTQTIYWMAWY